MVVVLMVRLIGNARLHLGFLLGSKLIPSIGSNVPLPHVQIWSLCLSDQQRACSIVPKLPKCIMLQSSTFDTRCYELFEIVGPGDGIDSLYVHDLRQFGSCSLVVSMLPRRPFQDIKLPSSATQRVNTRWVERTSRQFGVQSHKELAQYP